MKIGDLVIKHNSTFKGMGIVIDDSRRTVKGTSRHFMVTIHWLDGMGVGLYWTDELEVICK